MKPPVPTMLVVFACLSAAGCAQTPPPGAGLGGEQLLVPLPPGDWVVGHSAAEGNRLTTEYVPRGQTVEDRTQMLTVQIFRGDPTPALAFLERAKAVAEREQPCDLTDFSIVGSRKVNGYDGSRAQLFCTRGKRTDKGEITFLQALRGRDSLYVVQRAWRGPAYTTRSLPVTPDDIAAWNTHLNRVSVCDSRDPARPCPAVEAR